MTIPLMILAVLSMVGGLIGVPHVLGGHHELDHFLRPVFENASLHIKVEELPASTEITLMIISVTAAVIALAYAWVKYIKNKHVPVHDGEERSLLATLSYKKFYVDELYDMLFRKPLDAASNFLYMVIDKMGIDGIVNTIGSAPIESSKGLRLLQSGNVGFYIFIMVLGIIAVLAYSLGLTDILHK